MTGPGARIVLQYFDDCPNWQVADEHLRMALEQVGALGAVVEYEIVDTDEKAQSSGFHGSPTILLDGVDPFADENTAVGLSCRRYVLPRRCTRPTRLPKDRDPGVHRRRQ